jgi:ribosomal protein L37AE/L43A
VGTHEGFIGGRVFVPGTDTPMTRMFICRECKKLHVVRRGAEPPTKCSKCGCAHLDEAGSATAKKPRAVESDAKPEMTIQQVLDAKRTYDAFTLSAKELASTPEKGQTQKDIDAKRLEMADEMLSTVPASQLYEFARNWIVTAAQHATNEEYWQMRAKSAEEKLVAVGLGETDSAKQVQADDYRREWIVDRVVAWADVQGGVCAFLDSGGDEPPVAEQVWTLVAELYDSGRKLGYLP